MKKPALSLLFILFFTMDSFPQDPWTLQDTILQGAFTAVTVIDWLQTRQVAKNPSRYEENNKFLGKHPTMREVNSYFVFYIISHAGVSYFLPKPYRAIWQSFYIGMEFDAVQSNYGYVGFGIKF